MRLRTRHVESAYKDVTTNDFNIFGHNSVRLNDNMVAGVTNGCVNALGFWK